MDREMGSLQRETWFALRPGDREMVREIVRREEKVFRTSFGILYLVIFAAMFGAMSGVVLREHNRVRRYTETLCAPPAFVETVYCSPFKPPCKRAEVADLRANRSVMVRFPSYAPHLATWRAADSAAWVGRIRAGPFR
jgi:hypothetical protein